MKQLLVVALTLLLTCLATTALADRGQRHDGYGGRHDRGDRIDHRLDMKGERLERRFDRLADRAADRGHYRQAYRLKEKGDRISRRFDRLGDRLERRYDHRSHYNKHHHPGPRAGGYGHAPYRGRDADRIHLGVFVPGFWFSGIWHD